MENKEIIARHRVKKNYTVKTIAELDKTRLSKCGNNFVTFTFNGNDGEYRVTLSKEIIKKAYDWIQGE